VDVKKTFKLKGYQQVNNNGTLSNEMEVLSGVDLKIKDGETTEDRFFTLESVACLGCCSLAPVIMIGDQTYGKLNGNEATKIVKNFHITESN